MSEGALLEGRATKIVLAAALLTTAAACSPDGDGASAAPERAATVARPASTSVPAAEPAQDRDEDEKPCTSLTAAEVSAAVGIAVQEKRDLAARYAQAGAASDALDEVCVFVSEAMPTYPAVLVYGSDDPQAYAVLSQVLRDGEGQTPVAPVGVGDESLGSEGRIVFRVRQQAWSLAVQQPGQSFSSAGAQAKQLAQLLGG